MDFGAFNLYKAHRYFLVEGVVTHFHPMAYDGHGDEECFSVQSKRFCYSDYLATGGFHNTASHGGPIRAGIHVRLAYIGSMILRVNIAKDEVPSQAERRQREINAESESFTYPFTVAVLFLAVFVTLWWNVQWRQTIGQWLQPPIQPIIENSLRIFLAICFVGAFVQFAQHLRVHPFLGQPWIATVAGVAILCGVEVFILARVETRSKQRNAGKADGKA